MAVPCSVSILWLPFCETCQMCMHLKRVKLHPQLQSKAHQCMHYCSLASQLVTAWLKGGFSVASLRLDTFAHVLNVQYMHSLRPVPSTYTVFYSVLQCSTVFYSVLQCPKAILLIMHYLISCRPDSLPYYGLWPYPVVRVWCVTVPLTVILHDSMPACFLLCRMYL